MTMGRGAGAGGVDGESAGRKFSIGSHRVSELTEFYEEKASPKPRHAPRPARRKRSGGGGSNAGSRGGMVGALSAPLSYALGLALSLLSFYGRVLNLASSVHRFCIYLAVDVSIGIVEEVTKNLVRETLRQVCRRQRAVGEPCA